MWQVWKRCFRLVAFFASTQVYAQQGSITGTVKAIDHTALQGATVSVRGIGGFAGNIRKMQTDSLGHFHSK